MDGPTSMSPSVSSYDRCDTEEKNMKYQYDIASLGPAMFIVLVLGFLNKRKSYKKQTCSGRPGLVTPLDYFSGQKNRLSIAMAFGATAADCLNVIFHRLGNKATNSNWEKVMWSLLNVLHIGVINYPFFACLTTEHVIVGSCFGFLYTTVRLVVLMVQNFKCMGFGTGTNAVFSILTILPILVCLVFLLMRFAIILLLKLRKEQSVVQQISFHTSQLATPRNFNYVQKLLFRTERCGELRAPWFIRMRNTIYKPNPDFKFSTQMISTVVVAIIILFQIMFRSVYYAIQFLNTCLHPPLLANSTLANKVIEFIICSPTFEYSSIIALVLSTVLSFVHVGHMLACHRRHVYLLYHSRKLFFRGKLYSPSKLVGRSLSYSGYQIAYIVWGFVIVFISLSIFNLIVALIVQLPVLRVKLRSIILYFLPAIVLAISIRIVQFLLSIFVFRDHSFPNITVTVNNRQVYCIMAYFFFFLNIIVGVFTGILRILKGALLGIVFVARIDRTSLVEGFHTWDRGYVAYLGHVYFYVAHHHPVLLVFCQLLMDRTINQSDIFLESLVHEETSITRTSNPRRSGFRVSAVGYNRWFLAWTLMKNPGLISQRSKRRRVLSKPISVDSPAYFSNETLLVG